MSMLDWICLGSLGDFEAELTRVSGSQTLHSVCRIFIVSSKQTFFVLLFDSLA